MLTSRDASRLPAVARPARRGFTLAELTVVLVLVSIVGGTLMSVLLRQQRFYAGAAQVMTTRDGLRDAVALLPMELRALSVPGGDILAMTDSSIDFRSPSGHAVICTIGAGRTSVTIPPLQLARRSGLTSWLTAPQAGDAAFVFDEGATEGAGDDSWPQFQLTAAPSPGGNCPMSTGFTATASEAAAGFSLNLSAALPATVTAGAPIRLTRRARYSLYKAADDNWYLGFAECPNGVCNALQAVSGPYLPYAAAGSSGLRLSYFDSTGVATTDRLRVSRIELMVRARTATRVRIGGSNDYYRDSLRIVIGLRNRT